MDDSHDLPVDDEEQVQPFSEDEELAQLRERVECDEDGDGQDDSYEHQQHEPADRNEDLTDRTAASPDDENSAVEANESHENQQDVDEDSDDDEIKRLEAEAHAASGDEAESETGKGAAGGQLIADIFGDSDSEDEEFEGFKKQTENAETENPEEEQQQQDQETAGADRSESSDDEGGKGGKSHSDLVYDFDLMMQKKREENYRRRKRKNTDIINDSDDMIADMITMMKTASDEDFELNRAGRPASCKLRLLSRIEDPLRKIDLREALLDSGILSVITDWLTPLPDRSLPNIRVREVLLQVLLDFNISDTDRLKASGIGKAVMYLYKHPKETKENKAKAHRLIQAWSRPIFNNDADFHSMTKEEREERDKRQIERMREMRAKRSRSSSTEPSSAKKSSDKAPAPGEKGWIPRARVPMPSARDYVNRPKSQADVEISRGSAKKAATRYDLMKRSFDEKKRQSKTSRAVKVSIEGRKM